MGDNVKTGDVKFSISGTYSKADYQFTVENSGEFSITTDSFIITAEKFSVTVSAGSSTLNFGVSGTAIRNFTNHTFALAEGTTVSTNLGDYTISATAKDEAGGSVFFDIANKKLGVTEGTEVQCEIRNESCWRRRKL